MEKIEERMVRVETRVDIIDENIQEIRDDVKKMATNCIPTINRNMDQISKDIALILTVQKLKEESRQRFIDRTIKLIPYIGVVAFSAFAYWILGLTGII